MKIDELNFKQVEKQDSVIIEFGKFDSLEVIQEIDAKLMRVIPLELGSHDLHEIALDDSHDQFFTYGKNAEKLFKCMLPVLKQYDFLKEATVHLNFTGGDKEREIDFKLSSVTAG
ncbi:hypothetical protein AAFN75_16245 [Algibacter sp. AS12]|uniref:hypothetical protein n=1 Tax=Algibacter sp. AS12 TaxID=3135773 RepID=UPI00398B2C95